MKIIIIICLFFCLFWCLFCLVYCFVMIQRINLQIKELKKLKQRNEHLYDYRARILFQNREAYDKLPSYNEMLNSNKPLKDEYWVNFT